MFAEVLLWLLLAASSLVAIGLGIVLLRSRRGTAPHRTGPSQHFGTSSASPGNGRAAMRGPEPPERTPGPTLFSISPEERARLLAAASGRTPAEPSAAPSPPSAAPAPSPAVTPRAAIGSRLTAPAAAPGLIRGYVRASGGGAIIGASLTLIDLAGGQIGRGVTGGDGGYSLNTPGPGSYFLIARARGHHPQASTVTVTNQPQTLALVLAGLAELSGVVKVAGNEPVPGALVTLLDLRGEVVASSTTDAHGGYRFSELVGGSYTLAASASPFPPTARLVTLAESGATTQEVELIAGAYLRGTARAGRDGRPLPDARVVLTDGEGNVVGVTRTDAAGEYLFSDVPEGGYTVTASGYPPVTSRVRVSRGQKHEHDVELTHPDD